MPITTSHWSWPSLTRSESGSGSGRLATLTFLRLVDLFLGAMEDEDRLRAPEHLDDLPVGDRREVDLDRRAGRDGRGVRIHLRDQRHQGRRGAHRADGAGGDVEKVAARVLRRRHGRHVLGPLLRLAYSSARGWSPGPKSRGRRGGPVAAALGKAGQRVGGVLLAPLRYKRKPAIAPARISRINHSSRAA